MPPRVALNSSYRLRARRGDNCSPSRVAHPRLNVNANEQKADGTYGTPLDGELAKCRKSDLTTWTPLVQRIHLTSAISGIPKPGEKISLSHREQLPANHCRELEVELQAMTTTITRVAVIPRSLRRRNGNPIELPRATPPPSAGRFQSVRHRTRVGHAK